jgi:2-polyprenyl-6-methoxyphenol hydroxylase-like FAD-dependent oxidoreductase
VNLEPGRPAQVVVVGGGPAGAATALLLGRTGSAVTLFEQERARRLGAGILLQPNGLAVLYALGLRDALQAAGAVVDTVTLLDAAGRTLSRSKAPDFGEGLDHSFVSRRSHLAEVLDAALASAPNVEVVRGAEVGSVHRDGTLTVQRDGAVETVAADLVVGADGAGSRVRRDLDFREQPAPPRATYVRMIIDGESGPPAAEYWTKLGLFASAALGDGATYVYASVTESLQESLRTGDVTPFRDAWSSTIPMVAPLVARLESTDQLLVNDVRPIRCRTWVNGAVVLVGDAAHAMAPNLGQGANSALVDAAVLTLELADATEAGAACRSYEERRMKPVSTVQDRADRLARRRAPPLATRAAGARHADAGRRSTPPDATRSAPGSAGGSCGSVPRAASTRVANPEPQSTTTSGSRGTTSPSASWTASAPIRASARVLEREAKGGARSSPASYSRRRRPRTVPGYDDDSTLARDDRAMTSTLTPPRTTTPQPRPGFRLRGKAHKTVLAVHIVTAVGWFGIAVAVAFLAISASVTEDPALARALYRTLEITPWLSIPTGIGAFGVGALLSVGTAWGLVRHWWLVAKLAIATAVIVTDIVVLLPAAHDAVATGAAPGPLRDGAVAHCVALTVATVLSVFKPRGRTPRGKRVLTRGQGA